MDQQAMQRPRCAEAAAALVFVRRFTAKKSAELFALARQPPLRLGSPRPALRAIAVATVISASACGAPATTQWELVREHDAVFGGTVTEKMSGVAVTDASHVAVGWSNSTPTRTHEPIVWSSADRVNWERGTLANPVGEGGGELNDVAHGDGMYVAVGLEFPEAYILPTMDAQIWTSATGHTWERIEGHEGVFGGDDFQEMRAVVHFDSGFVAVGSDAARPGPGVWTSRDGLTWKRVVHRDSSESFGFRDVAVFDDVLIAVSSDAIWLSSDTTTWTPVFSPPFESDTGSLKAVAAGGPGVVAVASEFRGSPSTGSPVPMVFTSADGRSWQQVPDDEQALGKGVIHSLAAVDGGFVAVGSDFLDAAVWTSQDGLSWDRSPHVDAVLGAPGTRGTASMADIAVTEDWIVAVGTRSQDAAVWYRPVAVTPATTSPSG